MNARFSGVVTATLLAAGLLGPAVGAARAADRPPKGLHRVGDHWTAWNPPTPAAGEQVYVVVKGDTLWALAKKFYGDPYLWPQLWEKNQYVQDAHWIYPGDPLMTGVQVAPGNNLAQGGAGGTEPAAAAPGGGEAPATAGGATPFGEKPAEKPAVEIKGVLSAGAAAGSPIPLGVESDIDCSGYIGDLQESFPYSIVGSEYDVLAPTHTHVNSSASGPYGEVGTVKYGLSTGDIVYLNGGTSRGLAPGSQFTIIIPDHEVRHPSTGKVFGRLYRYVGRVRVLSVQEETAIAEISFSCDPVIVGAVLQAYQPEPVPLARPTAMRPVNYPATAEKLASGPTIILSKDDIVSLGEDSIVWMDRGANSDVTPGDIYTIYRTNRPGLPPVVLGEMAVLSVHARSSVGKIVRSRYTVFVGDHLDPK
jgi:LysM domain